MSHQQYASNGQTAVDELELELALRPPALTKQAPIQYQRLLDHGHHPQRQGSHSTGEADSSPATRLLPTDEPEQTITSEMQPRPIHRGHVQDNQSSSEKPIPLSKGTRNFPQTLRSFVHPRSWWWWWELGAMALSIICMCLIAAVLVTMNNRPLADWKLKLSPNAAISILTTVGKSSLMLPVAACLGQLKWHYFEQPHSLRNLQSFDEASRGPWGSFVFLAHTRGRSVLAALGAIITVIALGYEPSVQQVLAYVPRSIAVDGIASLTQASHFQCAGPAEVFVEPGYAIVNGLIGGQVNRSFECSTPECSFGPSKSLAMCSECRNITDTVIQHCQNTTTTNAYNGETTLSSCTFTPHDTFFAPITSILGQIEISNVRTPLTRILVQPSSSGYNHTNSSMGITIMNMTDDVYISSDGRGIIPPRMEIYTCSWSFCSHSYTDTNITNGRLTYTTQMTPLTQRNSFGDESSYKFEPQPLELSTNSSGVTEYLLDYYTTASVWQFLAAQLIQTFQSSGGWAPDSELDDPDGPTYVHGMDYGLQNLTLLALGYGEDIWDVVDNVAMALTALIQSPSNINSTQLQGQAMLSETYVHVRWPWLILPLCLTLGAASLLAVSIILSTKPGRT